MIIDKNNLNKMDKLNRVNFINGLSGFKTPFLLGTVSSQKKTNLSIVSSVTHLGSNPSLFSIIFRPPEVPRHSLENILEIKKFTLNHVERSFYKIAHQTSARYPREVSEFDALGIDKEYIREFPAPFVKQSSIKIAMCLCEHNKIKANNTVMVIGKVEFVKIDKELVENDGYINLEKSNIVCVSGLDAYHSTKSLGRLPYAKPKKS